MSATFVMVQITIMKVTARYEFECLRCSDHRKRVYASCGFRSLGVLTSRPRIYTIHFLLWAFLLATMDTFFELLQWLSTDDGMAVPKHWIGEAIAPLLDGRLVSAARVPTASPEPTTHSALTISGLRRPIEHDIAPWVSEVRLFFCAFVFVAVHCIPLRLRVAQKT